MKEARGGVGAARADERQLPQFAAQRPRAGQAAPCPARRSYPTTRRGPRGPGLSCTPGRGSAVRNCVVQAMPLSADAFRLSPRSLQRSTVRTRHSSLACRLQGAGLHQHRTQAAGGQRWRRSTVVRGSSPSCPRPGFARLSSARGRSPARCDCGSPHVRRAAGRAGAPVSCWRRPPPRRAAVEGRSTASSGKSCRAGLRAPVVNCELELLGQPLSEEVGQASANVHAIASSRRRTRRPGRRCCHPSSPR